MTINGGSGSAGGRATTVISADTISQPAKLTNGMPKYAPGASQTHSPQCTICGSRNRSHAVNASALIATKANPDRLPVIRCATAHAGGSIISHASGISSGTPSSCGWSASV